jgi:hypothetical protein
MFRKTGKYIAEKVTQSVIGRAVKWGFWSLVVLCPGSLISTVGIQGLAMAAVTVHSGLVEYSASKLILR